MKQKQFVFKRKIWFIPLYWTAVCWYLISRVLGIASEGVAAPAFFPSMILGMVLELKYIPTSRSSMRWEILWSVFWKNLWEAIFFFNVSIKLMHYSRWQKKITDTQWIRKQDLSPGKVCVCSRAARWWQSACLKQVSWTGGEDGWSSGHDTGTGVWQLGLSVFDFFAAYSW